MDPKKILIKIGPQHLAKGIERGLEELDGIIVGWPVKPSLIGNLAFTVLGVGGAMMTREPFDEILAIWAGHHSTTLWDYVEEMLTPATFITGRRAAPTRISARPGLTAAVTGVPGFAKIRARRFIPGQLRPKYQLGS